MFVRGVDSSKLRTSSGDVAKTNESRCYWNCQIKLPILTLAFALSRHFLQCRRVVLEQTQVSVLLYHRTDGVWPRDTVWDGKEPVPIKERAPRAPTHRRNIVSHWGQLHNDPARQHPVWKAHNTAGCEFQWFGHPVAKDQHVAEEILEGSCHIFLQLPSFGSLSEVMAIRVDDSENVIPFDFFSECMRILTMRSLKLSSLFPA